MRARLTGAVLASDMAAFKAANAGACLGDCLRWLSPRDWLPDGAGGGALSLRMSQKVPRGLGLGPLNPDSAPRAANLMAWTIRGHVALGHTALSLRRTWNCSSGKTLDLGTRRCPAARRRLQPRTQHSTR